MFNKKATNNITALRDELMSVFRDLKSGKIEPNVAAEMNNTAGKVINTVRAELQYAELKQQIPNIDFMEKH